MKFLEKIFPTKTLSFIGVIIAIFLVGLVAVEVAYIYKSINEVNNQKPSNTVSFEGKAEKNVKPDLAKIDLTVRTEADNPGTAQKNNSEKMNRVIEFLKGKGFAEEDLKTTSYSIHPIYDYNKERERQLQGYEVRQSLNVKIENFENIPLVLRETVNHGVNEVGSLEFTVKDKQKVIDTLIQKAVNDAKQNAKKRADYLGLELGDLVNFSYSTEGDRHKPVFMEASRDVGGSAPQVEPGTNNITVNVNLSYEVK